MVSPKILYEVKKPDAYEGHKVLISHVRSCELSREVRPWGEESRPADAGRLGGRHFGVIVHKILLQGLMGIMGRLGTRLGTAQHCGRTATESTS